MKMKLSKLTLSYGLYVVISACFIQQVWRFLGQYIGKGNLLIAVFILFLLLAALFLKHAIRRRFNIFRVMIMAGIIAFIFYSARQLRIDVEKLHILEYALLGWLTCRDLRKKNAPARALIFSMLFITLISVLDESLQRALPYRVGQIRDALINLKGGFLGAILFLCA